ncbi:hypothetical protein RchiOBHm_Chr1g0344551 [Rosa chinensis]|uniref:Uncharacterized protein n=1 Tax=Rosa chinensis TaxID=74649 RepID=A0A2P6SEJ8_ROSCH|nr:hypothetical protein RchiOBHm_Chr1g0344551 [Rosa chinensis]
MWVREIPSISKTNQNIIWRFGVVCGTFTINISFRDCSSICGPSCLSVGKEQSQVNGSF